MKRVIFFVGCFFFMINNCLALTMNCPEVASPGEIISVSLEEDKFNGIKGEFNVDSVFDYQNLTLNSSWNSYYDGVNGFSIGNVVNDDKLFMDVSFKVDIGADINKDYTLELVDIEGNDSNYKSVSLDNLACKVKLLSNVNTLDSLVIDGINLNPKFNKNTLFYEASTKNEKVNIKASASDSSARIEGDLGDKKLDLGINSFVIKVISARGNIREYKIYITRTIDKKSSDVTLKSLSLSSGKIDFDKNNFLYSVDVGYEVDNIEVEAVANDKKARVEIDKPDVLVLGENTINIKVIAEDGKSGTYVVIVNRKDKLSSDASIKNLIIKNYDINFKSDIYSYDLEIDGEDSLDIEVILSDIRAKYKITGNNNLDNNSVIEIEVIAEDGSNSIYKININKLSENNSSAIINYIKIVPLILFIVLIVSILVVKLIKKFIK